MKVELMFVHDDFGLTDPLIKVELEDGHFIGHVFVEVTD